MSISPSQSLFIYLTLAYVALVFVFNCNRRVTNVSMMMMMMISHNVFFWLSNNTR